MGVQSVRLIRLGVHGRMLVVISRGTLGVPLQEVLEGWTGPAK